MTVIQHYRHPHWLRRKLVWFVLPLLAVTLVAAACGGDDNNADPTTAASTSGETALTVKMSDALKFEPSELTVTAGKPVVLTLQNDGTMVHDFSIEKIDSDDVEMMGQSADMDHMGGTGSGTHMDMHMAVDPGKMGELHFTPMQSGEYTFFCSASGHQAGGMHGMLKVSAS